MICTCIIIIFHLHFISSLWNKIWHSSIFTNVDKKQPLNIFLYSPFSMENNFSIKIYIQLFSSRSKPKDNLASCVSVHNSKHYTTWHRGPGSMPVTVLYLGHEASLISTFRYLSDHICLSQAHTRYGCIHKRMYT